MCRLTPAAQHPSLVQCLWPHRAANLAASREHFTRTFHCKSFLPVHCTLLTSMGESFQQDSSRGSQSCVPVRPGASVTRPNEWVETAFNEPVALVFPLGSRGAPMVSQPDVLDVGGPSVEHQKSCISRGSRPNGHSARTRVGVTNGEARVQTFQGAYKANLQTQHLTLL